MPLMWIPSFLWAFPTNHYSKEPNSYSRTSRRLLVGEPLQRSTDTQKTCFHTEKLVPTHKTTEYFFCFYFNVRRWPGQPL